MKAKTVLLQMDELEKKVGSGPWQRWNQLRRLLEQASATDEAAEQMAPADEGHECNCIANNSYMTYAPHQPGCPALRP